MKINLVEELTIEDFNGKLKEVIKRFQDLQKICGPDADVDVSIFDDRYGFSRDSFYLEGNISYSREETEEEEIIRLRNDLEIKKKLDQQLIKKEENEKKLFMKLKKKYGDI